MIFLTERQKKLLKIFIYTTVFLFTNVQMCTFTSATEFLKQFLKLKMIESFFKTLGLDLVSVIFQV